MDKEITKLREQIEELTYDSSMTDKQFLAGVLQKLANFFEYTL